MLSARDNISYGNDRNGDDGLNDNNGDVYSSGYSESEAERSVEKDSMSQHIRCLTALRNHRYSRGDSYIAHHSLCYFVSEVL